MTEYEKWLQRNAWWLRPFIGVLIGLVAVILILWAVGAFAQGGLRCFVDSDTKTLKCYSGEREFRCTCPGIVK